MRASNLLALMLVFGVAGCAATPKLYPTHPLTDQIIKARAGYPMALTNRACLPKADPKAPDSSPGCPLEQITAYPLDDVKFRETANKLNFICNLGGKRFKICLDKPGFCRFSYTQKCAFNIPGFLCQPAERLEEYSPAGDLEFLLAANARCAAADKYDLW